MEQDDSISFSSVVAALLLLSRKITSVEIVNFLSKLSCEGIEVNDKNDDIDDLLICVESAPKYSYFIKDNLFYDTILYQNVTVYDFLYSCVDKRVLNVILNDNVYSDLYHHNFSLNVFKETKKEDNMSFDENNNKERFSVFSKVKRLSKNNYFRSFFEWGSIK